VALAETIVEGDLDGVGREGAAPLVVRDDLIVAHRREVLAQIGEVAFEGLGALDRKEPIRVRELAIAARVIEQGEGRPSDHQPG
jgi:hypothetical protein